MPQYTALFFHLDNASHSEEKLKHFCDSYLLQFHNDIFMCNFTTDLSSLMQPNVNKWVEPAKTQPLPSVQHNCKLALQKEK